MGLETQTNNIDDLNAGWPTDTDPVSEGAPQLRGIKQGLQGNVSGSGTETGLYNGSVNKPKGAVLRTIERGVELWTNEAQGITELQFRDLVGVISMRLASGGVGNVSLIARKVAAAVQVMTQYLGADAVVLNGAVRPSGALTAQLYANLLATLETQPGGVKAIAAAATSAIVDLEVGGTNLGGLLGNGTEVTVRSLTGDVALTRTGGATRLNTLSSGVAINGPTATDSALSLRNNLGVGIASFQAFQGQAFLDGPAGGQFNIRGGAATYLTMQPAAVAVYLNNAQAAVFAAGVLNVIGSVITNVAAPSAADHAANKGYVDGQSLQVGCRTSGAGAVSGVFGQRTISCVRSSAGTYDYTVSAGGNIKQVTLTQEVASPQTALNGISLTNQGALTFSVVTFNGTNVKVDAAHNVVVW